MKKLLVISILIGNFAVAADEAKPAATQAQESKVTTRDAKKSCKDAGKTGADLIKCIKEKKDEK